MSALNLLETLVSIPSVNPFKYFAGANGGYIGMGAEEQVNTFIEDLLRKAGFEVSRQLLHPKTTVMTPTGPIEAPARWNVLGVRYPSGPWNGKSILFFGHTDTVEVKQNWQSDPFSITKKTEDGRERWYGLGANDMKGGLAAIVDAISSVSPNQYAIKVAFVVDEEFYSFGAHVLCESDFMKDVVLAIAPEIGDGEEAPHEPKDHQSIGLGRTGRVEYDFKITGRACHGADAFVSATAVNAVHESVKLQGALIKDCAAQKRRFEQQGAVSFNSAFISCHQGGAPTLSIPDTASFVLDRTFLPDESPEAELTRLQSMVTGMQDSGEVDPRARITVSTKDRPTPACLPYITPLEGPEIDLLLKAIKSQTRSSSFSIGRSVADENRVAVLGIPTLTIGPTGAGSHTPHEWVDPSSVVRVAEIFKTFIASC